MWKLPEKVKKSRLTAELSRLETFENPKISLEQYVTPPELAASLLHTAEMSGDLEKTLDLGTGTGMLAIGAALLGSEVTAIEKDPEALETARKNAEEAGVRDRIEFIESEVQDTELEKRSFSSVVMNPPFSQHSDQGERFWREASGAASRVYSVSATNRRDSIKRLVEKLGYEVKQLEGFEVKLPATYGFHTQESRKTGIDLIIAEDD